MLCLMLCRPTDCSPPSSSVHGISQARTLEWLAKSSFSRGSSQPRDWTCVSCLAGRFFTTEPPGKFYLLIFLLKMKKVDRWNNLLTFTGIINVGFDKRIQQESNKRSLFGPKQLISIFESLRISLCTLYGFFSSDLWFCTVPWQLHDFFLNHWKFSITTILPSESSFPLSVSKTRL